MSFLYVSTSLSHFEIPRSLDPPRSFGWNGQMYRRLDSQFYAWLRRRIDALARMEVGAFEKAGVTVNDYTETLDRFSEIHEWAKVRMGAEKLEEITKKTNLKGFELRPYSPTLWDATDKVVISCIPGESDDSAIWAQISANERLATPAATAETTPQCLGTAPPKPRMIHTHPPKVNVSKSTEQSQLF